MIASRLGELGIHGPQHAIAGIHQRHLAEAGIDLFEIPLQGVAHQVVEGGRQLAAGGAAAHHHHRLQQAPFGGIGRLLSLLEGAQHPLANAIGIFERLHRRGELRPFVVAEIAAGGAGRHDQMVVVQSTIVKDHLLCGGVDVVHLSHQDLHIGSLPQHDPQRRGHIRLRHQP